MDQDKKVLQCSGCGATFKHAPSLSTHKNGNVKKGLKPCKQYYAAIGKEYQEKIESRTITEEEYNNLMSAFDKVLRWIEKEERSPSCHGWSWSGSANSTPHPMCPRTTSRPSS